jgi:predicted CXXCH cytochrome family protein
MGLRRYAVRVTINSALAPVLAVALSAGLVVFGTAPGFASDPPAPAFSHSMGSKTAGSPLLKHCGLPLFDAAGKPADRGRIGCGTCHADVTADPARLTAGKSPGELCTRCHQAEARLAGGNHDLEDGCLGCHQPHGEQGPEDLWTAGLEEDVDAGSAACLACHDEPEWGNWPRWKVSAGPVVSGVEKLTLSLRQASGGPHRIECVECHNAHAEPGNKQKMRAGPEGDPAAVCLNCHRENLGLVAWTGHRSQHVDPERAWTSMCNGCHRIHSTPEPKGSGGLALKIPAGLAGAFLPGNLECLACHATDYGARPRAPNFVHPAVPMQNLQEPGEPGFFPLFDETGRLGASGRIGCLTCHLPHGRGTEATDEEEYEPPAGDAVVPVVRRYAEPNLCMNCHPTEALERVLYFHTPWRLSRSAP